MEPPKNEQEDEVVEELVQEDQSNIEEDIIINAEEEKYHNNLENADPSEILKDQNNQLQKEETDDLMNKLNEEADKLGSNIDNDNLKIFSKYEDLSEEELKEKIAIKNEALLKLNDEKEESKNKLNILIMQLNELISKNSDLLYYSEPDPVVLLQLERVLEIRKRDLQLAKKTNQSYKDQCKLMTKRASDKLSTEKLNQLDDKIDTIKKENTALIYKIRELKDKSNMRAKELEICSSNKKYPSKIISFTEEVKSLSKKKHDYYNKLSMNKKSLENTLKEFNKLETMCKDNLKEDFDETIASKIKEWVELIKSDLSGTKEEIFTRVEKKESQVVKLIDEATKQKKSKPDNIYLPKIDNSISILRARSSSPKNRLDKKEKIIYKGIFSKFSYFNKEDKKDKSYMRSKQGERKKNLLKSQEEIKNVDPETLVEKDYENITEDEYKELLVKKEQLTEIIRRIDKSIKEHEKMTNKKYKDIQSTLELNRQKLNELIQQNELLKSENENLNKILDLTKNKLKNEIKASESKFIKSVNQQHINNDPSITGNDILMELKEEDEKKQNAYDSTGDNVIEEEQEKNLENQENNKVIKCKYYILFNHLVLDISNVEKIDVDGRNDREKRLDEIKKKYMSYDEGDEDVDNL